MKVSARNTGRESRRSIAELLVNLMMNTWTREPADGEEGHTGIDRIRGAIEVQFRRPCRQAAGSRALDRLAHRV
jgi:hypothetical protein